MSKNAKSREVRKAAERGQLWLRLPGLVREALYETVIGAGLACMNEVLEAERSILCGGRYQHLEEKTRNGKLRTLSGDGELAGARAKRPELVWPKRVAGPVIVASKIDVLPAERREMRQVVGLRRHAVAAQVIDLTLQVHGIPQDDGGHGLDLTRFRRRCWG